jgi:phospholipase/carboxylesterase
MTPTSDPAAWRLGPPKAKRLIAVLHGVGDSAQGLMPIGEYLVQNLPDTAAVVLDGHQQWDGGPPGRQWFSLSGVSFDNLEGRVAEAMPLLWARLDKLVADEGLTHAELVLFGFSQGAMMTLSSAATGRTFAAGLAFSGRLAAPIDPPRPGSPRLFITHGLQDGVVPAADGERAARQLTAAGYKVTFGTVANLAHSIALPQLEAAAKFLGSA